jgi:predicted dehydrogenase
MIYQFGFVLTWSVREMNGMSKGGFEFHGTKATLADGCFKVTAEAGTRPVKRRQEAGGEEADDRRDDDPGSEQPVAHVRNFLDCVKSCQRPNADVEEGCATAVMCHLGNIATRLGRSLRWDAEKGEIAGDAEANRWLHKEYRKPWVLPAV